jgi:hypothetical protein
LNQEGIRACGGLFCKSRLLQQALFADNSLKKVENHFIYHISCDNVFSACLGIISRVWLQ